MAKEDAFNTIPPHKLITLKALIASENVLYVEQLFSIIFIDQQQNIYDFSVKNLTKMIPLKKKILILLVLAITGCPANTRLRKLN